MIYISCWTVYERLLALEKPLCFFTNEPAAHEAKKVLEGDGCSNLNIKKDFAKIYESHKEFRQDKAVAAWNSQPDRIKRILKMQGTDLSKLAEYKNPATELSNTRLLRWYEVQGLESVPCFLHKEDADFEVEEILKKNPANAGSVRVEHCEETIWGSAEEWQRDYDKGATVELDDETARLFKEFSYVGKKKKS